MNPELATFLLFFLDTDEMDDVETFDLHALDTGEEN